MDDLKILRVEMKLTLSDGTEVTGHMTHDGDNQRWGASIPHLAACVFPMEAMDTAMRDGGHWMPEPDDDEDEDDEPASCPRCGNTDNDGSDECPDCGETMT